MDIAKLIQADIEARAELGLNKYGARLEDFCRENGKSPLENMYEEILDMAMYLKQHIAELEDGRTLKLVQREYRYKVIAKKHIEGWTQREISEFLSWPQPNISRVLKNMDVAHVHEPESKSNPNHSHNSGLPHSRLWNISAPRPVSW